MTTSAHVRDELVELVSRDLLGPWDGPSEELHPRSSGPRDRYLVGALGPKDAPSEPAMTDNDLGEDHQAGGDPAPRDVLTPQTAGRLWASSMGLSFVVVPGVERVVVRAEWGHYRKATAETQLNDHGDGRRVWKRFPVEAETEIRLDDPETGGPAHRGFLDVQLVAKVRQRDGRTVVDLALINRQEVPASSKDSAWLFQPRLTVTAMDGAQAIFCALDDPAESAPTAERLAPDHEDQLLALLYRDCLQYAAGRNVAVHADVRPGERRAHRLSTSWLPMHDLPQTVAPNPDAMLQLAGLELGMAKLAALEPAELVTALRPLANGYLEWLAGRRASVNALPAHLRETADAAIDKAEQIAARISAGILLLDQPGDALDAFRFANKAMDLQRRHTQIVRHRADHPNDGYTTAETMTASAPAWYPFQLAFILLNLPALTNPAHPERSATFDAVVDLLFFPTGGGKTEAYLGLTAYTFAIRRLQGVVGEGDQARDGRDGTTVLMRYTLRLLTAQQFQRAAALVCAAEVLRRDDPRLGQVPFRIGLWIGAKVTPNWFGEAKTQVDEAHNIGAAAGSSALQVLACPWCGIELRAERDLQPDETRRRILIYCGDPDGDCAFSRKGSPGEGLPILTVDEEIYRYTPSLVIATVDKLAQLPWAGYAGTLFGRVSRRCARHGYRHADMDDKTGCRDRHNARFHAPAAGTNAVLRLRPPDLIIQDELHLISGALGSTVGLFEAAVDELCTWQLGTHEVGPKLVASTATVKRAAEQVHQLYARKLAIFPAPVLDATDTFFSRQVPVTPATPGRRYLGVCAHGVRLKSAEIRLTAILLIAGQHLLDTHGVAADPYLTVVEYFNATRELAGMRRYLDDDVATRARRQGAAKGLSNRLDRPGAALRIEELTSRVSSAKIRDVLRRLEVAFDPDLDSTAGKAALLAELAKARAEKRPLPALRNPQPADVVLATSMLQVGVDVQRLGLMVMTGQPKNTAEYIQATSRVGRDAARPGLVVTLYNWARPRDLAHYENFCHYHQTMYRQVEALSVTPYARRALDREFAGTFVAAVRNLDEWFSRNGDAQAVPLDGELVGRVRERLGKRAAHVGLAGDYVEEKAKTLLDEWQARKSPNAVLGYQAGRTRTQNVNGLLDPPSGGDWTVLTVSRSMRETEQEINLLLPPTTLADLSMGEAPPWQFGPPPDDAGSEGSDGGVEDDAPVADELGDTWVNRTGSTT